MRIEFNEEQRVFVIQTKNTSYMMAIVDNEGFLGHVYYGQRIDDIPPIYMLRIDEAPYVPSKNNRDRVSFMDSFPMEYSTYGFGDFREDCLQILDDKGQMGINLTYKSHSIKSGKPKLANLPATYADEFAAMTLEIEMHDEVLNTSVYLLYSIFEDSDAIVRSARIVNHSERKIKLLKAFSMCMDFDNEDFEQITLNGSWARERHIQRNRIGYGKQSTSSLRGESSHQDHPFLGVVNKSTTQNQGSAYGFHFVYSGNFIAQSEMNQFDQVRVVMGIHSTNFNWALECGESFTTPEVVMMYSSQGIGGMTRGYHDLYRNHLIRGQYKDRKRPILINNWEATYFDFDTEKLIDIAKAAAAAGIEMLVMDDGWFGNRQDDNTSLGDWMVNEEKITGGLNALVNRVNGLGLEFGIWFEPEMVSPNSNTFSEHPDWAIQMNGRVGSLCRNQYVLDLSRQEVIDYVYDQVSTILKSANITYVKWDMNRQLTDLGSHGLSLERQGELYHRYVLGVYQLQERLLQEFPNILLENCSSGGARFDPGMLYYSPQIWASDDTDAIERLAIQEGTAMLYPLSAIGAHISDSPNHTVGRVTPFQTRGHVALAGTFGYELDITRISEEDRKIIPEQVAMYHKYNDLVRNGDYYRLASYQDNHNHDCWQVVSKDQSEVLVTFIQVMNQANVHSKRIKLSGLKSDWNYIDQKTDKVYSGAALLYAGLPMEKLVGDFQSCLIHLKRDTSL